MPKKRAASIAILTASFTCCLAFALPAQQNSQETTGILSRGPVASDSNIKSASVDNVRALADTLSVPPSMGGVRTRGGRAWCSMRVSNSSPLNANVYIDGKYWGTTPAFGDVFGWMRCRDMQLYARANFDDGGFYYWGPTTVSLKGSYTWRISRRR
jgi:hypothetical protein